MKENFIRSLKKKKMSFIRKGIAIYLHTPQYQP